MIKLVENEKDYEAFEEILMQKLEDGVNKKELVDVSYVRGIGKTYALIQFAKKYGYDVIVNNAMVAKELSTKFSYGFIYPNHITCLNQFDIKKAVIDESVNNIDELSQYGINIVTGYCNNFIKNKEKTFDESIKDTLTNEIKMLTPKIIKAREKDEFGTYKNLINAYSEVLKLLEREEDKEKYNMMS